MPEIFGRRYDNLDGFHVEELRSLQQTGSIYSRFWQGEEERFKNCLVKFRPGEIVRYADDLYQYDQFLGFKHDGHSDEEALERLDDESMKKRVRRYNAWVEESGSTGAQFSPAAFMADDLEALVCGMKDERYEVLQTSYTGDRKYLLYEIIDGINESRLILNSRRGDRPDFDISSEIDFQDLLYALIKPIFPDARPEEYTPKDATKSKRIDIVIPAISTLIEAKFVRNENHATELPDELKVDFESYYTHEDCSKIIGVVWDPEGFISDRSNFQEDLSGPRSIDGVDFETEVQVLP